MSHVKQNYDAELKPLAVPGCFCSCGTPWAALRTGRWGLKSGNPVVWEIPGYPTLGHRGENEIGEPMLVSLAAGLFECSLRLYGR